MLSLRPPDRGRPTYHIQLPMTPTPAVGAAFVSRTCRSGTLVCSLVFYGFFFDESFFCYHSSFYLVCPVSLPTPESTRWLVVRPFGCEFEYWFFLKKIIKKGDCIILPSLLPIYSTPAKVFALLIFFFIFFKSQSRPSMNNVQRHKVT